MQSGQENHPNTYFFRKTTRITSGGSGGNHGTKTSLVCTLHGYMQDATGDKGIDAPLNDPDFGELGVRLLLKFSEI